MGYIGHGYGSECHLLRWMGRHRQAFDKATLRAMGVNSESIVIDWLDTNFCKDPRKWYDAELKGLDFISDKKVLNGWHIEWPQSGNPQNWDAVGVLKKPGNPDQQGIVLVEAKAHIGEISTHIGAKSPKSLQLIESTLRRTADNLHATFDKKTWMQEFYQHSNRLAVYDYMKRCGLNPYLLFVYFIGDLGNSSRICPQDVRGWESALSDLDQKMGIQHIYASEHVSKLFLSVTDADFGWTSAYANSRFEIT